MSRTTKTTRKVLTITACGVLLSACGGGSDLPTLPPPPPPPPPPVAFNQFVVDQFNATADDTDPVPVDDDDFAFDDDPAAFDSVLQ